MLTDKQREVLDELYYNPKTGYAGTDTLKRKTKLSANTVKNYLLEQPTYTKHKPAVQKFKTRRVIVHGVDHQFHADLADMRSLSQYNDNFNYILTVIDVLSKYAWALPIKRKTGDFVVEAFKNIFKERKTKLLQTDHGSEFIGRKTQGLFQENDIKWFETYNTVKAQIVERFNRTLKDRMYKYFTANDTKRGVDVLPDLVYNYNNSYHRSIKMTPVEATENPRKAWDNLYGSKDEKSNPKFKPGDFVQISKYRGKFKLGHTAIYTNEVFVVADILETTPFTYKITVIRNAEKDYWNVLRRRIESFQTH